MYPVSDVNFLLLAKMRILSRITDGEKTGELISLGSPYGLLYMFGFVTDRNTERTSQSFGRRRQQNVLDRSPCRSEIVQRTLVCRLTQRFILMPEQWQDKAAELHEHP